MNGYTKLFSSIIHSTIWREADHIRLIWVTMMAMADRYGIVGASVPGLADAARVSIQECEDALAKLMSPDKYSRSKDFDGRRIEEVDGGWVLLNHGKYKDLMSKDDQKAKAAERQRRKRERDKESREERDMSHTVTASNACNDIAEAEAYTKAKEIKIKNKTRSKSEPTAVSTPIFVSQAAKKYLDIFNAVFSRNVGARSIIEKKVSSRLKAGISDWQIYCAPILQLALDSSTPNVRNFSPEMLLRDGSKARTSENGATHGATDWIERIYLNADKAQLDERLTSIANHFELTDFIEKTGAKIWNQQ